MSNICNLYLIHGTSCITKYCICMFNLENIIYFILTNSSSTEQLTIYTVYVYTFRKLITSTCEWDLDVYIITDSEPVPDSNSMGNEMTTGVWIRRENQSRAYNIQFARCVGLTSFLGQRKSRRTTISSRRSQC